MHGETWIGTCRKDFILHKERFLLADNPGKERIVISATKGMLKVNLVGICANINKKQMWKFFRKAK